MRIRTIKPEFWKHFRMSKLSAEARLLAIGLLNFADDEGYFQAHPALIRGELMPFAEKTSHIPKLLTDLEGIGYLRLYQSDKGEPMGHIVNFLVHQRINRPTQSRHSRATHAQLTESSVSTHAQLTDDSLLEWKGNKEREEEGNGILSAPDGAGPSGDGTADVPAEPSPCKKKKVGGAVEDERNGLQWSAESGWQGFDDVLWDELAKAYPACDIRRQFLVMEQWLKSNPSKARKSNWRRFVTNWLQREQDRGGDLRGQPAPAWAGMAAGHHAAAGALPAQVIEDAPEGLEDALLALWGDDWRAACPAWPQMLASDKAQVRRWLAKHFNKQKVTA